MALIRKKVIFDLLFKLFSKRQILTFLPDQFCTNYELIVHGLSLVGLRLLVLVLIRLRPFGAINK